MNKQPVSPPHRYSDSSLPSNDADHCAWDTNPDEHQNYPAHFDGSGQHENSITTTYGVATYLDYDDSDDDSHLYIGDKPTKTDDTFDVHNYTEL